MNRPAQVTPFLWFDANLNDVAEFYSGIFSDFRSQGSYAFSAVFELGGTTFMAANFGPAFKFNEAISLFVSCEDQTEVDFYWNALLVDGGEAGRCGWLKDKYGLSWQVVPTALGEALGNPDREAAAIAQQAMMGMGKIVIADLTRQ